MSTGFWCALLILAAGPAARAAAWKALGPFGGPAAIVQTDPISTRTVVAGTRNALLFLSRDSGENWRPLAFPLQFHAALHAVLIHPTIPDVYVAGVSPDRPGASGMWRTENAGASWRPIAAFDDLPVRALATFRGDPLVMAAGTERGVFRTSDGGLTWTRISPADHRELQPVVSIAFDPKDRNILYAGTPHLAWKTIDGGASWRSVYAGMLDDSDIFSIVVDRNRAQRVFAGACSGIYRSLTSGAAWSRMRASTSASDRTYTLAQDPQYENVLYAGTTHGLLRSGDGGVTWDRIAPYAVRSIAFDLGRLGRIFLATDEAGVVRSEDNGTTWQPANRGFANRRLGALSTDTAGTVYLSDSAGLYTLDPDTAEWIETPASPGPSLKPVPSGPGAPGGDAPISEILAPPWRTHAVLAAAGSTLFITRDFGKTWKECQFGTPIRALAALDPPWVALVGAEEIFLTKDGESWASAPLPDATGHIYGVVSAGTRLLMATTAGLKVSDGMGPWQPAPGPLGRNTVQAIYRHPTRPSVLFAASYGLIFSSPDGGRSWHRISPDDWPAVSVKQIIVSPREPDLLLALTPEQGVFALGTETSSQNF